MEGLLIESWSGRTGYSAKMLTEGAQSWQVEGQLNLTPSVNIKAKYPVLADHKETVENSSFGKDLH